MRTKELVIFIKERESVRLKKEAGKPRPWTKDPILDRYRFCNVHREDDAVTKWVSANYRAKWADREDLWFAMVVARLLNLPASLAAVEPFVLPFKADRFRNALHVRKARGDNNFNAAYIVSTNGRAMDKVDYITYNVLEPLWKARKEIRPKVGDALDVYHGILMNFDGLGSFMAAQIVADLKYAEPLCAAPDWHTWAASGPGSRRGLNRVMGSPVDEPWKEAAWLENLTLLRKEVLKFFPLHAQDLQNCLCEFDKFERVRLGEGRPKQIYQPRES